MIRAFCEKLNFPQEATDVLCAAYQELVKNPENVRDLKIAEEILHTPWDDDWELYLHKVAERSGVPQETVDMILLLMAIPPLQKKYQEWNLPEQLMWETLEDLTCKLWESWNVRGVWGTFVSSWFKGFYVLDRFKLGRLEYEKKAFDDRDKFKGESYHGFQKGDVVVNCHIPSAGPLTPESVMDSLRRAWEFYADLRKDGKLLVMCDSWLLYPGYNGPVFPEGSNMQKFQEMFDIIFWDYQRNKGDFWRTFNVDYAPEVLDTVPTDTTLRRNLLKYIKAGNEMGSALGYIVFDGEKIIR